MKKTLFLTAMAALLTAACGTRQQPVEGTADSQAISMHQNAPGDSALYGLACDGCTDSILVVLPYSGGDPDTFDISGARARQRIFGRPHIGDELAVILNPADKSEALMVINTKELTGDWCYIVSPTLRNPDQLPPRKLQQLLAAMPDSVRQELMKPLEYTIRLKADNTAMAFGSPRKHTTTDEISPVEYPSLHRYTDWQLTNGHLVLKADTIGGFNEEGAVPHSDTATIKVLMRDTLVLQFPDHEQGYYKKQQ